MRATPHEAERFRIKTGPLGSPPEYGNNGAFEVLLNGVLLYVVASDGAGWEHVSVSHRTRCPNWNEMCAIKAMFWGEEETVIQFHPPKSQYVNRHKHCLHLWKPAGVALPSPPTWMIG